MRRTDKAVRYQAEKMRSGLFSSTKLAWTFSCNVAENAPERTKAVPAGLERDLYDLELGISKERLGALNPPRQQIAVRRHSESILEGPCEMRLGNTADLREALNRPFFMRGLVHTVLGAKQPAKQERISCDQAYLVSFL